jgi:hypothetical protein
VGLRGNTGIGTGSASAPLLAAAAPSPSPRHEHTSSPRTDPGADPRSDSRSEPRADPRFDPRAEPTSAGPRAAPGTRPEAGEQPFVDAGPAAGPPEALVLDIGGDTGALLVYADETCLGAEIDLSPDGSPRSHHVHTMIRRRRAIDREFVVGVYPGLTAGAYTVWGIDGGPLGRVVVTGGAVAEFHAGDCRAGGREGPS